MPLQLCQLEEKDFEHIISHASLYEPGDDLVGQPAPLCWPVTTRQDAQSRSSFHFAKQRSRLEDPTIHFMKVIDTSNDDDIVSIARWHFYPNGYNFDSQIHWETIDLPAEGSPPEGFNMRLYNHILTTRDAHRSKWQVVDSPCWILNHLVTRPSQRGKGAAGLLVRWGIEQAVKDGAPAYLEAGVLGRPVYEKYGFEQVGDLLEVDLSEHGVDTKFVMCKMAYFPQKMN